VIGLCFGNDRGKYRMNRYRKLNAGLLLANMHNTVAYVLTAQPNYITSPLASVEQQAQG
jgi:hypothetical protein